MKIQEYKYKIRMTQRDGTVEVLSLQKSLDLWDGLWLGISWPHCTIEIINREKHKVIYEIVCHEPEQMPYYIVEQLLDGVPEHKAIPKKTLVTIGELIEYHKKSI